MLMMKFPFLPWTCSAISESRAQGPAAAAEVKSLITLSAAAAAMVMTLAAASIKISPAYPQKSLLFTACRGSAVIS
jgi:hypothetical protein